MYKVQGQWAAACWKAAGAVLLAAKGEVRCAMRVPCCPVRSITKVPDSLKLDEEALINASHQ